MNEELANIILEKLETELHIEKSNDFISDLYEKRAEDIHISVTKNEDYKIQLKKIQSITDELYAKYQNSYDIINSIEDYEDAKGEIEHLIEMHIYKAGLHDGMKLIIDGLKNRKQDI